LTVIDCQEHSRCRRSPLAYPNRWSRKWTAPPERLRQTRAALIRQAVPRVERKRLVAAIDRLSDEPHAGGALKGEFSGMRRLRVGRYRVVYEAMDRELTVLIVRIGHRREVYR
jgi:mRNA interferase RelE/StbE